MSNNKIKPRLSGFNLIKMRVIKTIFNGINMFTRQYNISNKIPLKKYSNNRGM